MKQIEHNGVLTAFFRPCQEPGDCLYSDKEDMKKFCGADCTLKLVMLAILVGMMCSCKTQAVATDKQEHINWTDSTRYHYINVYDTTHILDTLLVTINEKTQATENTSIQFGQGGGTYNTKTGEATNVAGVKTSATEEQLRQTNATLTHDLQRATSRADSLANVNQHLEQDLQEKAKPVKVRYKWDIFTTWWFVLTMLYILVKVAWWAFRTFYLHK